MPPFSLYKSLVILKSEPPNFKKCAFAERQMLHGFRQTCAASERSERAEYGWRKF